MPIVQIPVERIHDWDSFHDVFSEVLGFPSFYGRNVSAWVDCLTDADRPETGMLAREVCAGPGDVLTIQIDGVDDFAERCPWQFKTLVHAVAFVNHRRIAVGDRPILALSYFVQSTG